MKIAILDDYQNVRITRIGNRLTGKETA